MENILIGLAFLFGPPIIVALVVIIIGFIEKISLEL